ncbi:phage tail tape measure protein [Klebsiella variicola]|uniref:phage tail tape measure protein n=1 Tax=Klebsiella variicola TaxID=244366 RepID=UPI000C7D5B7C|nr:phage tail tape measure protein [Klebsiella variicola]ELI6991650.1 phage tail tape measure protein [Klebsiella pneumoniae]PLK32877.1 phage tail tape measure protein [Klebsiella variicola]REI46725.1 phage tail tape measure protein [Klebsiella variicola]REI49077.1 phage tail tape measure protein [Klebsiella variicola]REI56899.1 phage tail tape measure protein [Klebsiella variicola]
MDLSIRVAFSAIDKLTRPVSAASKAIGGLSDSLKKTQSSIKDLEKSASSFDKLRSQANDTAQKLRSTQRAFDGLNQKQREGEQLTEAQTARLETLRNKLSRLTDTYNKQTTQLRAAGQAVRQHGVNLNAGSGAVQAAIRRTEQYGQALERERQRLAAVTRAQASYERAKETGAKLRGGGTMAIAGAAAAGYAGGRFLAPAVGFDEEMSRVQALTRLDKGDSQLAALRAQAKKLGAETAFTTRDAASGQAFLAMAGFTPQSIQAALPGVLNMALAGGMELGESADIGSNILSQFTLPADEMDRVSDVLTAAFTRTNTDLRSLGDTMKYAGPVASKLGISLEEAAGMAGILANNGLRGSDAGTAMRASLARLASPTAGAAKALKQLGVSVSDARGKMRPVETILLDLYKATKKYGQVDQVGFFKDIAGEEAFVGLQTLVAGAGSGELQKLVRELKGAGGEASAVAKKMADNLSGDLKNLDSAWEGFRIQIEETVDGPLRKLTQGLSDAITAASEWAKENPRLTKTLILIAGALTVLTGVIGVASLAASFILGPFAKLKLAIGMLGLSSITATSGISALSLSLSGLRVILASVFGIPGLIAAAFIAAGLLIWKFWEPIKAFFSGLFDGILRGLSPLLQSFSFLSPVFSSIANGASRIWNWFSRLFSPIDYSRDALNKCANAGKTFGEVLGAALNLLFTPLRLLTEGVGLLLEKLGLIPSALEAAKAKASNLSVKAPTSWEWDPKQKKMVQKEWGWSPVMWEWDPKQKKMVKKEWKPSSTSPKPSTPLGEDNGTLRRLNNIADNTKATANNTKKIGPGDIVFKNLPRALALRGPYQEARVIPQPVPRVSAAAAGGILSVPTATQGATSAPVAASSGAAPFFQLVFNDVGKRSDQELEKMVRNAVRDAMASTRKTNRGSFRDRE